MFGMYPDPFGFVAPHPEAEPLSPGDTALVSLLAAVVFGATLICLLLSKG